MNTADYVIITVIALSSLLSIKRGFTIEAISLGAWVAAFVIGRLFSTPLAYLLTDYIDPASARELVAFVALFVATLIVAALIKRLLKEVVSASGLSTVDRILGIGFGALRGIIILVFCLGIMARFFEFDKSPWWPQSLLIPHIMLVEDWTYNLAGDMWQKIMDLGSK